MPNAVHVHPEDIGFVAVFYTLCVDVFRITVTSKGVSASENKGSITLKASLFHAIADFMSTIIALVGFGLAALVSYYDADAFASIILSLFLVYLSVGLLRGSFFELSDAVPRDLADEIKRSVLSVKGVLSVEGLKVHRVGEVSYVDLTITAHGEMSLIEAHEVTKRIEQRIGEGFGKCVVTTHVEPGEGS